MNCSIQDVMSKLFGTDGIRGIANEYPVTPDLCVKLAVAVGKEFIQPGSKSPRVIIAKDTRLSGYLIEYALSAGFISIGLEVILVGPMPTPSVSMLVRSMRADIGVMVSASHNPYQYNGIKFFNKEGEKISPDVEARIEDIVESITNGETVPSITGSVGRTYRLDDAQGRYIEFLKTTFDKNVRLDGMKIVIDAANGSAYKIAPTILWELGAEVISIAVNPNGLNINSQCGATCPRNVATEVLKHEADVGVALDGDADRVIMCDENGQIIDGDKIIAFLSTEMGVKDAVVTHMSNLALDKYLGENGVNVTRADVGDKFVYAKMVETGAKLGGESSGHIILNEHNRTGDGLIAALNVLSCLSKMRKKPSYLNELYSPYPRIFESVEVDDRGSVDSEGVQKIIQNANASLGENGRVFVRASGTEPVVRILAECRDEGKLKPIVEGIKSALTGAEPVLELGIDPVAEAGAVISDTGGEGGALEAGHLSEVQDDTAVQSDISDSNSADGDSSGTTVVSSDNASTQDIQDLASGESDIEKDAAKDLADSLTDSPNADAQVLDLIEEVEEMNKSESNNTRHALSNSEKLRHARINKN